MTRQRLGIIADDLTGAMDSSGYFATRGLSTVVILGHSSPRAADVVVITTNSRGDEAATASEKVRQVLGELKGRVVYKKIDSTLRGNVGAELAAVMEELACDKAIVAPAFPAVGRTVVDGLLLVNGVPVAETQFANDPVSPVTQSDIPRLLEQSTRYRVGSVAVGSIARGPESLYRDISSRSEDVLVCDTVEQSHLHFIACASALAKGGWLLCGSGGLARELHVLLTKASEERATMTPSLASGPALLAVGSRHQVTAGQLRRAHDELGLALLDLEVERLGHSEINSAEVKRIVLEAGRSLSQGKTVAVTSTFSQYVPELKRSVAAALAKSVADILATRKLMGLFLCGGDIAVEVCRRLSVAAIQVYGEVEPGVPAGEFISGQARGIRVVTKAGGFGRETAIIESISYLERGHLS